MRALLAPSLLLVAVSLLGCTPSVEVAEPEPASELGIVVKPELRASIREAGFEGGFVVFDPGANRLIVSDPEFAEQRQIPASTFKIPNSLIALETGVADSSGFTLAWDGVERWNADWNGDQDLRSAFAVSCVWFYQELARRIGEDRMAKWLTAADYGNADMSGGLDMFWLSGAIRISPREQVEFLHRLATGASPFSPAVVTEFFDSVMIAEPVEGGSIRAKTGTADASDIAEPGTAGFEGVLGWYVGIAEPSDREPVYFALLVFTPAPMPDGSREDRIALAPELLRELGYF